jgi:type IV secretory pathway VirB4 component
MRIAPRHPAHTATTAQLAASYPFISEGGLGGAGCYVGVDLFGGGSFAFFPWTLMRRGIIAAPHIALIGQSGKGKSALAKCLCWRLLVFGVQCWLIDPKGECGPLCEAAGVTPIRLEPHGRVRLNPLDPRIADPQSKARHVARDQLALLQAILETSLQRRLSSEERTACELALREAGRRSDEPTLPGVVAALLEPSADDAAEVRTTPEALAAASREAALELRRMVSPTGDLAGMFDGPTTGNFDLAAPMVSLDLSAVRDSDALGVLMTCAAAWMQRALRRRDGVRRLVVWDEAWEIMAHLGCARWMRRSLKYGRAYDVANLVIAHRATDFLGTGDAGSEQQRIAQGLLQDCETRIFYWQRREHLNAVQNLVQLTDVECDHIARHGPRGRGLWQVGQRSFVVQHVVGPDEWPLVRTDDSDLDEDDLEEDGVA